MKTEHKITLSSGKIIELTSDEYKELEQSFKEVEIQTIPVYVPQIEPIQPWRNPYWYSTGDIKLCDFTTSMGEIS